MIILYGLSIITNYFSSTLHILSWTVVVVIVLGVGTGLSGVDVNSYLFAYIPFNIVPFSSVW